MNVFSIDRPMSNMTIFYIEKRTCKHFARMCKMSRAKFLAFAIFVYCMSSKIHLCRFSFRKQCPPKVALHPWVFYRTPLLCRTIALHTYTIQRQDLYSLQTQSPFALQSLLQASLMNSFWRAQFWILLRPSTPVAMQWQKRPIKNLLCLILDKEVCVLRG